MGPTDARVCHFGMPGPLRDRLVDAVLRGKKTASISLVAELKADGEQPPAAGERQTVVNSADQPVAVIELTAVEVISLGDADADLVRHEGEGFHSVAEWRQAHELFWSEHVLPRLPNHLRRPLSDETPILVESFRLVS